MYLVLSLLIESKDLMMFGQEDIFSVLDNINEFTWKFCTVQIALQVLYALKFGDLWSNCANMSTQNLLLFLKSKTMSMEKWFRDLRSIPHHKYTRIGHWILCICTSDPCCNNEQGWNIRNMSKHRLIPQFTLQTRHITSNTCFTCCFYKVP